MDDRAVIKFGGADLSTGWGIRRSAEMVVKSSYKEVVVVVSAIGKTTDKLEEIISQINISDQDYAEIVSIGERTSARIFCSALRSLGANTSYFDPSLDNWPLITDSNFRNAKPNMKETKSLVKKFLEPMLGEAIPVVCGFLGRDRHRKITTLGRGGSDITALLLANCLEANEVILVKDVEGVLSSDPKIVPNVKPFDKLDIHEMFALAQGGAKIVRAEALTYKRPNQRLRIVGFSSNNLVKGGTEITGTFNPFSVEINQYEGLSAITVVCKINPENLSTLFSTLHQKTIYGVSTGKNSITVFSQHKDIEETINKLHNRENFKAISYRDKVGIIEVTHPVFIDSPGWVSKIAGELASKDINIIEITTGKATINIFIDEKRLKDASKVVGEVFEA
ncbi:aspartate kinase [Candidatus Bathyarchaeota archaeon]|nr:aspartate kinase [Candidatus Bathyarchaeota archaeon]